VKWSSPSLGVKYEKIKEKSKETEIARTWKEAEKTREKKRNLYQASVLERWRCCLKLLLSWLDWLTLSQ